MLLNIPILFGCGKLILTTMLSIFLYPLLFYRAHNDGLEGWNPMRDDYNNRTFNAYDCGLGKDLPNRGAAG